jgi:peptidoglycan/LPS O-acetylase OafA/YrhL
MKRANCLSERLVIYTVVILLLLLIFLFCSKSPTNVDNTETDLNSVTAAVEVLGSADSLYQAIFEAQGRSAAVTATVNYLNSFTSVVEAGMSPDSSVYEFYENGLLGCV